MTKATRGRYTLEFKQEAVRLVESGQSMAAVSRSLGVVEQTLYNWVKAHRAGTLKGPRADRGFPRWGSQTRMAENHL
jgi:transposase